MSAQGLKSSQLVDPYTLVKIANLALRARLVVDGVLTGLHKSPHHGSSVEFAEHKEYTPGDEMRDIDWKLYAKSDRYTVKRYEEETNLRAYFFIDASGSMRYGSSELRKWDYAVTLATSLAYLMLHQSDAVGCALVSGSRQSFVPARSDTAHFRALIEAFERFEPEGRTPLGPALDAFATRLKRRGLVIVVSDGFNDLGEMVKALSHLRHRHHEVVLFQVLDPAEVEFPFEGLTLFESLEDDESVLSDASHVRAEYLRRIEAHNAALEKACRAHEIDCVRSVTSTPVVDRLVRYLGSRR